RTSEALKREKLLYTTKSGPYKGGNTYQKLVERCENIMGQENTAWFEDQMNKEEEEEDDQTA
ncbi:MAG: hypothetical protein AAFP19_20595, partial [Bacteroidota bacterium]